MLVTSEDGPRTPRLDRHLSAYPEKPEAKKPTGIADPRWTICRGECCVKGLLRITVESTLLRAATAGRQIRAAARLYCSSHALGFDSQFDSQADGLQRFGAD